MNIYVDFDDCLCETARYFSGLVKELFDKDIPYEQIQYFNLKKSFSLSEEQYLHMMERAHRDVDLLSLAETPGAVSVVNGWIDKGYDVSIVTGRPYNSYEASREWLDEHSLKRAKLYCLNKYRRDNLVKNTDYNLELEDYYKMHFDVAVEDSPAAFRFFDHLPNLKVMVYDRPWNRGCDFPTEGYVRCEGWDKIALEYNKN